MNWPMSPLTAKCMKLTVHILSGPLLRKYMQNRRPLWQSHIRKAPGRVVAKTEDF